MRGNLGWRAFIASLLVVLLIGARPAYAADGMPLVVSLGDSYAAGDGIKPYYGQESEYKYWDQDWIAHRSQSAWEALLTFNGTTLASVRATPGLEYVQNGETRYFNYDNWSEGSWYFVATSSARVAHVYGDMNWPDQGYLQKSIYKVGTAFGTVSYTNIYSPQIKVFDYLNRKYGNNSVDYVTVTVGGNDIGFADIISQAALTINNVEGVLSQAKSTFTGYTKASFERMCRAIREAAGPQANIIIVGYPTLFDGGVSLASGNVQNPYFSTTEMNQIDDVARWLDQQYADAVNTLKAEGMQNIYYVSLIDTFKGHGAYSGDDYVSGVVLNDVEALDDSDVLRIVSSSSMHLTAKGAEAIAGLVQELINAIEGVVPAPEPEPVPVVIPHAPGWAYENGAYYYYESDGSLRVNAWASYKGSWYYLGNDGRVLTSSWISYKGSYYYVGANGKAVANGWAKYNGKYYYLGSNGKVVTNGWARYGSTYYYMNAKGRPVTNTWIQYKGAWYYFDGSGACVRKIAA